MFPSLEGVGGVQGSARIASEWLITDREDAGPIYAVYYGRSERAGTGDRANGRTVWAASKAGALMAVAGRRWPVAVVLIWHVGLLKLLPFLRVARAQTVLFLHGIEVWRRLSWSTRHLLGRVDLFISNSDYTWERFLTFHARFAGARHRTVHLGTGSPLPGPSPEPADPPTMLMIGRMLRTEDYKGHREMIAVWPRVLTGCPKAELWIIGDGDLRPELEVLARARGVADRVRFLGPVSEDGKQSALARCRSLALPSHGEGFGLVYLEAMRFGRPCLSSTVDAGREVINPPEAGLAVDPSDPDRLADAAGQLLSPGPRWTQWSTQARRRYERQFTAALFQERLDAALAEVGGPGGGWVLARRTAC